MHNFRKKYDFLIISFFLVSLLGCSLEQIKRSPACSESSLDCKSEYLDRVEKDKDEYRSSRPYRWVDNQVQRFIQRTNDLPQEVPRVLLKDKKLEIKAKRNPFRDLLYKYGVIEAGERTLFMTDKLYMSRILEHYLGKKFSKFHLKTIGLKEFLSRHKLVDKNGKITAKRDQLKKLLELEFSNGVIAKPAIGMSSNGKGFYSDLDEIVDSVMSSDGALYSPEYMKRPYHWSMVKRFTSGEEFILQEKIDLGSVVGEKNDLAQLNEYRVHTFYDKVVEGGTETRWSSKRSKVMNQIVNDYVQEFLDSLPKQLTYRQGWALDVIVLPNNSFKIIEINTNRGFPGNWSGYSFDSRNLGAYVRHIEKHFKWYFKGVSGFLLRNNLGNLRPYIRNESRERWESIVEFLSEKKKKIIEVFKAKESSDYFSTRGCSGILCLGQNLFFSFDKNQRVGLEVELSNLSQERVVSLLQKKLGGNVEEKLVDVEYVEPTTQKLITYQKKIMKLKKSSVGSLKIVLETNESVSSEVNPDHKSIVEIITNPIDTRQASLLQEGLDLLVSNGAIGTNSVTPVSIQVNVEMLDTTAKEVIRILRNWYNPENYNQLSKEVPLFANREAFVGSYSPGFMNRLFDQSYSPTKRELFDDFFYRQVAEYLDFEGAWSDSIGDVQVYVQKNMKPENFDQVLKVFKWNDVRISSLLMYFYPDDWISQYMENSKWIKPLPLIEFRRPNNNFKINAITESIVGFVQESKKRLFTLSSILGDRYGIRSSDLKKILEISNPYSKPYIVRQFLGSPDGLEKSDEYLEYESLVEKYERRSIPIWVDTLKAGDEAYLLPGESIVFHRLPGTSENIMGKYNPALINGEISKVLDHKFIEFAFWNKYAPQTMARTQLLSDFGGSNEVDVRSLKKSLDKKYPNGWVIKGIWDTATQKEFLITSDTDLESELRKYKANYQDFIDFRSEMGHKYASSNPDMFTRKMRERDEFTGYRVNRFIKKPHEFIVQEKLEIVEEYRVEVIAGKVLADGSTIPRYQYSYPDSDEYLKDPNIKKVEIFTQQAVDQLPKELRNMTFGMDIALLKDGSIKMIESNPQGNSGFLAYDKRSIKALDKFLQRYPQMVKDGIINQGMTTGRQVSWIRAFVEDELSLVLESEYPHLTFLNNAIVLKGKTKESCRSLLQSILNIR